MADLAGGGGAIEAVKRDFRSSTRVRVLINAIHAKTGGGVTHLRNILPFLAQDERLEIHLFLHATQYERFAPLDERVRVHLFEFKEGFFRTLFWEQIVVPIMARSMRADVTFSPANYGPLLAPNPVIMLRNVLSVVGRERRFWKRIYWGGLALMTIVSLLRSRHAIAVSDYALKALSFGLARFIPGRLSVVHHGVDPIYAPPPDGAKRGTYLLTVSDIYVQKNLHTLIEALAIARERHPGLKLRIAGRRVDEGYYREVERCVAAHSLKDAVEFMGPVSRLRLSELYRDCALFVFPSTSESFGHPLVEAMASGAAVASSDRSAMPEILGEAGCYFDPLDPGRIAENISMILDQPALAEELGREGRRQVQRFSWPNSARLTADIFVRVGGEGRQLQ